MNYEYDIAISFAGEDRAVAQHMAKLLAAHGVKVFYDEFEEAKMWGEDLYVHLHEVYSAKARYCIMLLSEHYARKAWTNLERQSAQERAFKESQAYILPVRIDSTSIPGIRETVGYISLKSKTVEDVVSLALAKLGHSKNVTAPGSQPTTSRPAIAFLALKKSFTERDNDRFLDEVFVSIRSYFLEGISQLNTTEGIDADFKEITATKFLCKVYLYGKTKSACTIWYGGSAMMSNGIKYLSVADPEAGSSTNEILSIVVTDTELAVKPMMNMSGGQDVTMNMHEAAEYLWLKLIEPLNR